MLVRNAMALRRLWLALTPRATSSGARIRFSRRALRCGVLQCCPPIPRRHAPHADARKCMWRNASLATMLLWNVRWFLRLFVSVFLSDLGCTMNSNMSFCRACHDFRYLVRVLFLDTSVFQKIGPRAPESSPLSLRLHFGNENQLRPVSLAAKVCLGGPHLGP